MSILQQIKRGVQPRPQRVIIYGPEGVGKSTLAAGLPSPIFVDTEEGTSHLDVARVTVTSLEQIEAVVNELLSVEHGYRTFVLDTIDWAEAMLIDAVVREAKNPAVKSIEDFGYGKGYVFAAKRMEGFLKMLNGLLKVGMSVVLLGHSRRVKFEQPESVGTYDKYELKLTRNCAPLVKEWSDAMLFLNFVTIVQDGKGQGGVERVLYTSPQAPWEAKNRCGLPPMISVAPDEVASALFGLPVPQAEDGKRPMKNANRPGGKELPAPEGGQEAKGGVAEELCRLFGDVPTLEFLVARGELAANGSWGDVPQGYAARMLRNPDGFRKAVMEWKGGMK